MSKFPTHSGARSSPPLQQSIGKTESTQAGKQPAVTKWISVKSLKTTTLFSELQTPAENKFYLFKIDSRDIEVIPLGWREYQQIERISGCPHLMPGKHGLENNEGSIQAGYCFHLILMAISFSLGGRSILGEFNKQF